MCGSLWYKHVPNIKLLDALGKKVMTNAIGADIHTDGETHKVVDRQTKNNMLRISDGGRKMFETKN